MWTECSHVSCARCRSQTLAHRRDRPHAASAHRVRPMRMACGCSNKGLPTPGRLATLALSDRREEPQSIHATHAGVGPERRDRNTLASLAHCRAGTGSLEDWKTWLVPGDCASRLGPCGIFLYLDYCFAPCYLRSFLNKVGIAHTLNASKPTHSCLIYSSIRLFHPQHGFRYPLVPPHPDSIRSLDYNPATKNTSRRSVLTIHIQGTRLGSLRRWRYNMVYHYRNHLTASTVGSP